ncbi:MAG: hypothetical protein ACXV3C_00360 [Actinomycetes bacterium]
MTVPVARTGETTAAAAPAEVAAAPPVVGSPAVVGVPMFVVGSVALGLALTGYVPATATGAAIPIIMTATGLAW